MAGVLLCAYAVSCFSVPAGGHLMLLPVAGMVWAWSKVDKTVWHRLERTQDVLLPAIFGFVFYRTAQH
ncbi:hypothetical protein [Ensifer sp. MJa1]|uniref:hypothetical protein n=1 Tax=Ensifer sp. MJa1 TaxID=2919888 RepID=UPI00300A2020